MAETYVNADAVDAPSLGWLVVWGLFSDPKKKRERSAFSPALAYFFAVFGDRIWLRK